MMGRNCRTVGPAYRVRHMLNYSESKITAGA